MTDSGFRSWSWGTLLLGLSLLLLAGASFSRRVVARQPSIGVEWEASSVGPVAVRIDDDSPAGKAGLSEGDVLVSLDGFPLTSILEAREMGWRSGPERIVSLEVQRGGVLRRVDFAPEWRVRSEPYLYLVVVGVAFWLSGLFIAIRWPELRGGTAYAAFAACVFARLTLSSTGEADALDWTVEWVDSIAGALWPAALLHFGVSLTRRTVRWRLPLLTLGYGLSFALIGVWFWLSPAGLGGAYRALDPAGALELPDRAVEMLIGLSALVTAVLLTKSLGRSSSALHRSQMRWLLCGLAAGLGPYVLFCGLPWAVGAAELPGWAQFLAVAPMLFVPATFTAALARYRLYDLDVILLRVLSEVAAIFGTFAVLAFAIFLLREGVGGLVPLSRSATRYVGFLLAAVAYPTLRQWVRSGVERAFYRQRYSYRATLLDWARELNAETDLPSLLDLLRKRIRDTLGISGAEVLLRTGPWRFETSGGPPLATALELDDASLRKVEQEPYLALEEMALPSLPWARYLFPLKVKGRVRAVLAIAEREPREEPLNTEDRALVGTFAAHAATAIEAARLVLEVRQRADEIERLHALQQRILESSAVGLLLLDGAGRILTWNRALEEIYGLPRSEAIERRLGEVFPLHVVRRIERESAKASAGGSDSRIFRLNVVNREGKRLLVNIAISRAVETQVGEEGSLVVTFDDVTERVRLEEQLLQQERLASLGLLAAGVAHEINTPLTGISSYAQLLMEEGGGAPRAVLEKIEAQARRASNIANSLLNLARPDRAIFEPLGLNETVREALQLFEPQVRGKGVRIVTCLPDGLPPVRGHRGKLQQVLLNLLLNARDAVSDGGEIVVTTSSRAGLVVLEVADDGVGISEEDLPRIFDPFFSTKGRTRGTGLGLSISYGIVQEHQGRIHAESGPGGPTRFRVELPLVGQAQALA